MQTAYMSLGEACERLRIPPRTFRQLMADFGDLLEAPRPSSDGKLQELSVGTVDTLQHIMELRNRGVSVEAIRSELQAGSPASADGTEQRAAVAEAAGAGAEVAATAAASPTPNELAEAGPQPGDETLQSGSDRSAADKAAVQPTAAQPSVTGPDAALLAQQQELLGKLEELTTALSQSEKKRIDDRDRLLTALMRTQVEIQQLRHALAATASRRDRKQQSWVARWFA